MTDNGHIAPTQSVPLVGPRQTEKAFMQAVLDYARLNGWKCYHTHDPRRSEPGFPDLVLCRPWDVQRGGYELVFLELKTDKGRLSEAQRKWMDALGEVADNNDTIAAMVVRPSDWDRIERLLARRNYLSVINRRADKGKARSAKVVE